MGNQPLQQNAWRCKGVMDGLEGQPANGLRIILVSVFVSSLVTANLISSKMIEFGFFGMYAVFPAGTLAYCVTFLCTDIYDEFFGRGEAGRVVLGGFIANVVMVFLVFVDVLMPIASFQKGFQETYSRVLGVVPGVVFASMVAYLISQTHDVYAFHFGGEKTGGKHLWLRNNASTIISQGIDTVTFSLIANILVYHAPLNTLIWMILTLWFIKYIIALLDTPFCYLGVNLVKKRLKLPSVWERKSIS